ncbi:hypothetical protein Dda_9108 [Drechslerella dactyloides]|uniref:Uncharacterized protein n=1 Tax=Drechslerella dactyloides TaxID=74499 RepID=A0AAD6ITA5_DREDA|nr:hypothetical protein Dda_9108 [Drechslerella dactyloides]
MMVSAHRRPWWTTLSNVVTWFMRSRRAASRRRATRCCGVSPLPLAGGLRTFWAKRVASARVLTFCTKRAPSATVRAARAGGISSSSSASPRVCPVAAGVSEAVAVAQAAVSGRPSSRRGRRRLSISRSRSDIVEKLPELAASRRHAQHIRRRKPATSRCPPPNHRRTLAEDSATMDPRLAQILQALSETAPVAAPQQTTARFPAAHQAYNPAPPPPVTAPVTNTAARSQAVDPRTITQWPAALKYITTVVTNNPVAMDRLRKMKAHQREHEQQWWSSREAIVKRHSNSSNSQSAMDSVLKSFGVSSTSTEATAEEKRKELAAYDDKVHRASQQMYDSMAADLKKLDIPFFVLSDADFPGDSAELPGLKKRVVELLDDLT